MHVRNYRTVQVTIVELVLVQWTIYNQFYEPQIQFVFWFTINNRVTTLNYCMIILKL